MGQRLEMVPVDNTVAAGPGKQYIQEDTDVWEKTDTSAGEARYDTNSYLGYTDTSSWESGYLEESSGNDNTAVRSFKHLPTQAYICTQTLWQRFRSVNCLFCDQIVDSSDTSSQSNPRYPKSSGTLLLSNNKSTSRGYVFRPPQNSSNNNNGEHYHREEHHINQKVVTIATLNIKKYFSICVLATES